MNIYKYIYVYCRSCSLGARQSNSPATQGGSRALGKANKQERPSIASQSIATRETLPTRPTIIIATSTATMNIRQKIQVLILLFLIFMSFANYHAGTGSVVWLQWLTIVTISAFMLVFDLSFTNDSQFIFDPDAENWRRKTVSRVIRCVECMLR
jgi:hypothetical protein